MKCVVCKSDFSSKEAKGPRAVCDRCATAKRELPTDSIRKPPRSRTRKPDVSFANSKSRKSGTKPAGHSKAQTTTRSARAVTQAWREQVAHNQFGLKKKYRFDGGHPTHSNSESDAEPKFVTYETRNTVASARHAVSFGLLVFLMGQCVNLCGFLTGHLMAWSIGTMLSVGGITVSLLSVNEAIRRLER